jgi:coenzyme PQQ precursor peptide PqqA
MALAESIIISRRERSQWRNIMKATWTKPQVTEQEVGLEVTSYLAAEI